VRYVLKSPVTHIAVLVSRIVYKVNRWHWEAATLRAFCPTKVGDMDWTCDHPSETKEALSRTWGWKNCTLFHEQLLTSSTFPVPSCCHPETTVLQGHNDRSRIRILWFF